MSQLIRKVDSWRKLTHKDFGFWCQKYKCNYGWMEHENEIYLQQAKRPKSRERRLEIREIRNLRYKRSDIWEIRDLSPRDLRDQRSERSEIWKIRDLKDQRSERSEIWEKSDKYRWTFAIIESFLQLKTENIMKTTLKEGHGGSIYKEAQNNKHST